MLKYKDMFTLLCVCSLSVFPQRPELLLYSGRASPTDSGLPRSKEEYSQRNGKSGIEISQEGKNLFQSAVFYTNSPNVKHQDAKWFKEDSLGQGIPAHLLVRK